MKPIEFGDTKDVVACLYLSRQFLEDLMYAFGPSDGFVRECQDVLRQVYADEECQVEKEVLIPGNLEYLLGF